MSEIDPQAVWNVALAVAIFVVFGAVLYLSRKQRNAGQIKTITMTGTYCGHCGKRLNPDPERAVALEKQSYFVYKCGECRGETLLPTQSL